MSRCPNRRDEPRETAADVLSKYAPADVTGPIDTVGVGHTVLEGGAETAFSISAPLGQPFADGTSAFTSSQAGTTAGTASVDVTAWAIPPAATLAVCAAP